MLAIPRLYELNELNLDDVVSLDNMENTIPTQELVKCPMVKGSFIQEGECYEFQSFASENGPKKWLDSTRIHYAKLLGENENCPICTCLQHQIEIYESQNANDALILDLKEKLAKRTV